MITAFMLFRLMKLMNLRTFQNDDFVHNNPIDITLWESCKIWDFNMTLNLVLLLRIRMKNEVKSFTALHFCHIFNDSFISHLCCLFMTGLNDECMWTELKNWLDENVCLNYFWFNILLWAIKLSFDNINQISEFKQYICLQSFSEHDCKETADAVLTITFYFELVRTLVNEASQYRCEKTVRYCNNVSVIINSLQKIHGSHLIFSINNETLITVKEADICKRCCSYSARVKFHIWYLEDSVSIYFNFSSNNKCKIDGFPHLICWFIQQQELDTNFEWSDYKQLSLYVCATCCYHCVRSMHLRRWLINYKEGFLSKCVCFC